MLGVFSDVQPMQRDFGLDHVMTEHGLLPVTTAVLGATPFWTLTEFKCASAPRRPGVLVVTPLSGHFAFLVREVVLGLLPSHRVMVTNWINAAHIPPDCGSFGFEDNITAILDMLRLAGGGSAVLATCQGVVPTLAATAIAARHERTIAPRALVLIAGPVDPLARPTRVVHLLRERPLEWFGRTVIGEVPAGKLGAGRAVYRGATQYSGLQLHLMRHIWERRELFTKTFADDGIDPWRFPFLDLYGSLMDLPADVFLENIATVFQEPALCRGNLVWHNTRVDCSAIDRTALMTIEGANDDIAAPGQTIAAHRLCPRVPDALRRHLLVPNCGHFSLIHGRRCRTTVLPEIRSFLHVAGCAVH